MFTNLIEGVVHMNECIKMLLDGGAHIHFETNQLGINWNKTLLHCSWSNYI